MNSRLNFFHLGAFAFLGACSNQPALEDARPGHVRPAEFQSTGSLSERLLKISSNEYAGSCDRDRLEQKLELIAALENTKSILDAPDEDQPPTSGDKPPSTNPLIRFQGSYLLNLPKKEIGSQSWISEYYDWDTTYYLYSKNKENLDKRLLLYIKSTVERLLENDESRVLNGTNLGLDRVSIPMLPLIYDSVKKCVDDAKCLRPVFSESVEKIVRGVPFYLFFIRMLESDSSESDDRERLVRFLNRIEADMLGHQPRFNPLMKQSRLNEEIRINLPLDPGVLSASERELAKSTIEEVWARGNTKVTVEWKGRSKIMDLFTILFHPDQIGKSANVTYSDRTMNLYPLTRVRSIAHEFGHIIGFDDHYYTVWDDRLCSYVQESTESDIMSNSESGVVTDEEWSELLKVFEEKPAS
jgi:hypothetical protein